MSDFDKWKETMTNYQFNYVMELYDRVTSLEQKDEDLYHLVKTHVESGKTPKEILAAVETFRGRSGVRSYGKEK